MIPCPFHFLTGLNCPFCGTQRLAWALLHGNVSEAFHYNPFVFCLLPVVLLVAVFYLFCKPLRPKMKWIYDDKTFVCYLLAALSWSIMRNIWGI